MVAASELERNVCSIIAQVVTERLWPSYPLVVGVLLRRYGVQNLSELQPLQPVTVLPLLLELNIKVDLFVTAFVASARSISTLADCEQAAVSVLRSFCMPPLDTQPSTAPAPAPDRNQILLDEEEDEEDEEEDAKNPPSEFTDYGLGPLHRHPRVADFFALGPAAEPRRDKLVTAARVLTALVEFRRISARGSFGEAAAVLSDADVPALASYLCSEWGVASLSEAGVALRAGSLLCSEEELFVRHIEAARVKALKAAAAAFLRPPSSSASSSACSSAANNEEDDEDEGGDERKEHQQQQQQGPKALKRRRTPPIETKLTLSRPGHAHAQAPASASASASASESWSSSAGAGAGGDESICHSFGPAELGGLCVAMPWAIDRTSTNGHDQSSSSSSSSASSPFSGAGAADVNRDVGRWGEALVYNLLLQQHPDAIVSWVNEKEESRAPYDLTLTLPSRGAGLGPKTVFVEVKTSRFPSLNVFEISPGEWDFASRDDGSRYRLYRVYCAGCPDKVRVTAVLDLKRAMESGALRLCLGLA